VPPADHDRGLVFWQKASGLPLCQSAGYPEYQRDRTAQPGVRPARPAARDGPAWVQLDVHTDDVEAEYPARTARHAASACITGGWCTTRPARRSASCRARPPRSRITTRTAGTYAGIPW